jgi:hypothetical protein
VSRNLSPRKLRRLSRDQRDAYDLLVYGNPGPAERARLKIRLGWRRTRAETIALVDELLAAGRTRLQIAGELGVDAGYVDRLLKPSPTPEIDPKKDSISRGVSGPSEPPKVIGRPSAPIDGFHTFAELDEWLDRRKA